VTVVLLVLAAVIPLLVEDGDWTEHGLAVALSFSQSSGTGTTGSEIVADSRSANRRRLTRGSGKPVNAYRRRALTVRAAEKAVTQCSI
jgi:hypothetical protein